MADGVNDIGVGPLMGPLRERGIVIPGLGLASLVSAGDSLPTTTGRSEGDLHIHTGDGFTYVLTNIALTENFTAPDGPITGKTSTTGGKVWSSSTMRVSSNHGAASGVGLAAEAAIDSGVVTQDIMAKAYVAIPDQSTASDGGVFVKGAAASSGIYATYIPSPTVPKLRLLQGGVQLAIKTLAAADFAAVATYVIYLQVVGTLALATIQNAANVTDVIFGTCGLSADPAVGVRTKSAAGVGLIDNFTVYNLGGLGWLRIG